MTILVIAAHPDDEVLGCGASIAKWVDSGESVHIIIMAEGVTSRDLERNSSGRSKELSVLKESANKVSKMLGVSSLKLLGFPDNRMDSVDLLDVTKAIELEVDKIKPTTVVTHHAGDLNIDHRVIHKAVITACRPQGENPVKRVLAFETPSSTEWQLSDSEATFHPNWFEDVSDTLDIKMKALKIYQSEMRESPHSRSFQGIESLAKWRGATIGCDAAESFILLRELR